MIKGSKHTEEAHARMRASHPRTWSSKRRTVYENTPRFAPAEVKRRNVQSQARYRVAHQNRITQRERDLKVEVLTRYGRAGILQCSWDGCDVQDVDVLTLDHIKNDGAVDRKNGPRRTGKNLYRRLRTRGYPDGYQTLCANHQLKKELLRIRWVEEAV